MNSSFHAPGDQIQWNDHGDDGAVTELAHIAPRPQCLEDTGLSLTSIADLVSKHILSAGTVTLTDLSKRTALTGTILEKVLAFLRQEARIHVTAGQQPGSPLRYSLTERGRTSALDAQLRSGYVGPAPVPLKDYAEVARAQTVHDRAVTRDAMQAAFNDLVLRQSVLDQLGPALNSGRAIFIYGPAGTGKTYITRRLARLFRQDVLIPHAIAINDLTVAVFDPMLHSTIASDTGQSDSLVNEGHDPRYVRCERPTLVSGGELTADMLDVQYDAATREYTAPLQLKANNGLFIIDDMGRQRVEPETVFNRWIVPMEERKDYLSLGSGRHFSVPFDVVLIFSTNQHPLDLADEAFLRRIGYKVEFGYLTAAEYARIWQDTCREAGIVFDSAVLDFAIEELHAKDEVPLLPCHPRDLLGMALDQAAYLEQPRQINEEHVRWAWRNYFVSPSVLYPGSQDVERRGPRPNRSVQS
jgi:hypothetical protein